MNGFPMFPEGTVDIDATTTSANVALVPAGHERVIVTCPVGNADLAFVRFGDGDVVATAANGVPCLPGSVQTFSLGDSVAAAAICPSSTAKVYFTVGDGV